MNADHLPEAPSNVVARATGPTTLTLTWDAPWYAGSTPVTSYDIVVEDAAGHRIAGSTTDERTSMRITELVAGEAYHVTVAARSASGASLSSTPVPVTMNFSRTRYVKEGTRRVAGRLLRSVRTSMSKEQPTGLAARDLRNEYRDATQEPHDPYEAQRSWKRDEGTTWVPPTGE